MRIGIHCARCNGEKFYQACKNCDPNWEAIAAALAGELEEIIMANEAKINTGHKIESEALSIWREARGEE